MFIVVVAAMSQIITIARGGEGLSGDGVAFVFVLCFVLYLTPGISHLAMNLLTSSILSSYYIAHVSQAGKVLSSPRSVDGLLSLVLGAPPLVKPL